MSDEELLHALLAGDEQAFAALVARYHPMLIRVARYYVGSDASAQDVAQETWLAVLRGLATFEGRSSIRTWLYRICANRARSIGAREHRIVSVDLSSTEHAVPAERFDERGLWREPPQPFTEVIDDAEERRPLVEAVSAAIGSLGEPYRSVVTLRDREGLSTEEVADLLGLSSANVRVILHRARARVRAAVEDSTKRASR